MNTHGRRRDHTVLLTNDFYATLSAYAFLKPAHNFQIYGIILWITLVHVYTKKYSSVTTLRQAGVVNFVMGCSTFFTQ